MGPSPLDPREIAARALSRRDLSQTSLASRLRGAGVAPAAARETLDWLVSVGLVDDARLARTRAGRLAERGYGDVAIDTKLAREGILREDREAAITELEPEEERARRAARGGRAGGPRRLAAFLAGRGFGEDAIEAAVRALDGRADAELR